ncbi:MAG: DUF1552 domain-containing protein [Vicinamibacterales bacterium]
MKALGRPAAAAVPGRDGAALTALEQSAAKPRPRFQGAVYTPNGVIRAVFPTATGADFEFSPSLKPLEAFRKDVLVLSGLDSVPLRRRASVAGNNHADASTRFLTDVTLSRSLRAGVSIDLGWPRRCWSKDTVLPSPSSCARALRTRDRRDFGRSCLHGHDRGRAHAAAADGT